MLNKFFGHAVELNAVLVIIYGLLAWYVPVLVTLLYFHFVLVICAVLLEAIFVDKKAALRDRK